MKYSIKRKNRRRLFHLFLLIVAIFTVTTTVNASAESNDTHKEKQGNVDDKKEAKKIVTNAREAFKELYVPALDILPTTQRLDMLDYWDVDSIAKISNAMEGLSWIEELDSTYMRIHLTPVSQYEIKVLPVKKGKIVMTIYTVGSEEQSKDSQIDFFSEELEQLKTDKYIEIPDLKDFFEFPKGSVTNMKEVRELIPFPTVEYSASSANDNLNAVLTVKEYMTEDDYNVIKLFLKPSITLKWKKEKYRN